MILIFSFYATNFRFHFHPLHYLHFAPIMNAFSFYFPPFLAFLNAERNMIVHLSEFLKNSYRKLNQVIGYNGTWFAQKGRTIGVVLAVKNSAGLLAARRR